MIVVVAPGLRRALCASSPAVIGPSWSRMSRQRYAVPCTPRKSAIAASSIWFAVWAARTDAMNVRISSSLECFDTRTTSVLEPFELQTITHGGKREGDRSIQPGEDVQGRRPRAERPRL